MMDKGSIHFTIDVCVEFYIYSGQQKFQMKNYEEVEISRITDIIKARRWSFIGHILRFENTNDCRIVMNWTPVGKRAIGRPNETWWRMAEKERDAFGWTSWAEAAQRVADRAEWRTIVHALCDTWRPRDP